MKATSGMADFSSRRLRTAGTLGERFRKMREERQIDLESIAQTLNIRSVYLDALEEGRYLDLPGDVYVRNFVRKYAEYLGANPTTATHLYEQERRVFTSQQDRRARASLEKGKHIPTPVITPRRVRQTIVVLIFLAILFYLGVEARRIISPPALVVSSPAADMRTTEKKLNVVGNTEPEATVHINGEEVIPDSSGAFTEEVQLVDGINVVTVTSKKARGAAQTVVRNILVEQPSQE